MKARRPRFAIALFLAGLFAFTLAPTTAHGQQTCKLSGRILNSSGKNAVYVAIWKADDFLKTPIKQIRIAPGADPVFTFEIPAGRYAISAFEDRNSNGVLDMGLFGPKEPSGFWPAFSGWHKPRFEEVAFSVNADISHIDIALK